MFSSKILGPTIGFFYRLLLKPILFTIDPEKIHDKALVLGNFFGSKKCFRKLTKICFYYKNKSLEQNILGINFKNPVGLAAGFDKNGKLINIVKELGFGFTEIGSVTGEQCPGNPKPRLWRLPKSKSLAVYYGLANEGAETIAKRAQESFRNLPIGLNIAKTNHEATNEIEAGIKDYLKAWQAVEKTADYITINISCPNTFGGQPFIDPNLLERLLSSIGRINYGRKVFVKLSPDINDNQLDNILGVIDRHKISGIICSNLTHDHSRIDNTEKNIKTNGGLSGKVLEDLSNDLLKKVYLKTNGRYVLIGCGGIFTAQDAYKKIRLGASLVELITGMIYEGPQLIGTINRGLVKLLKKDGFNNITEAIGADCK